MLTKIIIVHHPHHPSLRLCLKMLLMLVMNFGLSSALYVPSQSSSPTTTKLVRRNIDESNNFEQCYFHISGQSYSKSDRTIFYGQCMSKNGPDGCCLEGHYKPGICSNLGHICCTKPDPECNAMRYNKGITKSIMKQYGRMFIEFNSEPTDNGNNHRAIRSNQNARFNRPYKYQTNFDIIEMPAHMQLDAVTFVVDALDRYNGDFDYAADYLCRMLDQKYTEPNPWACTIGKDFGYSVEPEPGKYMLFYVGHDVRVMAFVNTQITKTSTTTADNNKNSQPSMD